ncbi:hypothetical protein HNP73_002017 [Amaricoccus macauensis]|uniref:Uncharacterized protein n=1 Tax=Amaricoccus macauensis TaxID=57001 RepID=A0A840SSA2_9RHOB|nr:hypothetical protein [Amaricoccus macauensis]MBB5222081.1 hypothetical protein [Amaricoccus macauensis]
MSRNTLLGAACLLLVGLLVGYIAGSGGPSLKEIDQAVSARLDAASKAEAERAAALDARVAELGTRVDAVSADVKSGADAVQGLGDRLGGNLADLGTRLGDTVNAAGASSVAALQGGLERLQQRLAAAPAANPAADVPQAGAAAPEGHATGLPAGTAAGETLALADAARVFVSRVDDAAGEALVYIDGEPMTLKVGETAPFQAGGEECQLTLAAVDRGHASLTGGCGSDLPKVEGTSPGAVAVLADGAVRVFVSAVDQQSARIAINGIATQEVAVGETVDVASGEKACRVTVTGVDRGHVTLDAACS